MEQNRLWLAILLSLGLFFAYDYFVIRPYREAAKRAQPAAPSTLQADSPRDPVQHDAPVPAPADAPEVVGTGSPVSIETDLFRATIDSLGGRLRSFEMKQYRATVAPDSPPLELVSTAGTSVLPFTLQIDGKGSDAGTQYAPDKTSLSLTGGGEGTIVLQGQLSGGTPISKTFTFRASSYVLDLSVEIGNGKAPETVGVLMTPIAPEIPPHPDQEKALVFTGGKRVERLLTAVREESTEQEGALWAGFSNRYFAALVVSEEPSTKVFVGMLRGTPVVRADEMTEQGVARYRVLIGPKDSAVLKAAGDHLDRAVDFGWFWFIAIPLLQLLRLFDRVFGNYGVSIILLTVLVKVVTIPLTRAQYRSMQKMQQIQPHLERLKERYKDDSSGMQREMMELYRKHGVNPFSGCVPMLLQIPIFVGLYNALLNAIELRHAPFVGWINDLSAPDWLMLGGLGIPVLVILMGASMLVQQWMTPMQGDPTQRRMMMFMPVIFTAMFLNFPSGLVLYWLVNNVISIIQQYAVLSGAKQGARA